MEHLRLVETLPCEYDFTQDEDFEHEDIDQDVFTVCLDEDGEDGLIFGFEECPHPDSFIMYRLENEDTKELLFGCLSDDEIRSELERLGADIERFQIKTSYHTGQDYFGEYWDEFDWRLATEEDQR